MKNNNQSTVCSSVPTIGIGTTEHVGTSNGKQMEQGSLKTLANKVIERNAQRNNNGKNVFHRSPEYGSKCSTSVPPGKWNPELAAQGYVWCLNCQYFNNSCTHPDNVFRSQQPLAPRKCNWFRNKPESSNPQ